jgi:hypothetical protein
LSDEPVFRAGYSLTYDRYGTNWFTSAYGNNPGMSRAATRTTTAGTPVIGFDGLPVLLREHNRLFPSVFPDAPTYPFTPAVTRSSIRCTRT